MPLAFTARPHADPAVSIGARPPAVAGRFYADDPVTLERDVRRMLCDGRCAAKALAPGFPKALIVPHAGYMYSGEIAAAAYAALRPARGVVKRVVVLGPAHRVAFRGLAVPAASAFTTPLGTVPVDAEALATLRALPHVGVSGDAHALEHAIEVQLPFLQVVLGAFSLVPVVVGDVSPAIVAETLEHVWGGRETLVVVSSDLSHYLPSEDARRIDAATCRTILALGEDLDHHAACGATPIAGLVRAAAKHGLAPRLVDACNSGDTSGDRSRVVGYASFVFEDAAAAAFDEAHGRELLRLARASIASALHGTPLEERPAEWLGERRATFVTLHRGPALRGCIGSIEARRALGEDVQANAIAAAFADPRFPAVTPEELDGLAVEVSVLSQPTDLDFTDERDLHAQLRPGVDGVVLECGGRRATFLPQVWEMLPEPAAFLDALKAKAGLPPGVPISRCRVSRYAVQKWSESSGDTDAASS